MTGKEQVFHNGIRNKASIELATSEFITTTGADGTQGKILGENISLSVIPPTTHYTPLTPNLQGHFRGIDEAIGDIVTTTAGITQRIWFTADVLNVSGTNYYVSNPTSKGTALSAIQSVINDDNQKTYFAQDIISAGFPELVTYPSGVYAGQLSCRISTNVAQQEYTVEVYKTNASGVPIASGIVGAPIGDLGVQVIAILDSGLINIVAGNVTGVPISGVLSSEITFNAGERVRYHVAAEKVGVAGSNITMEIFYGSDYNSYYDAPVVFDSNSILNRSEVSGSTVTNALNSLNNKIPVDYSKIVYVNASSPNLATIFDLNNPPITNDDLLKNDVNNLYIGTDNSTWVYLTSPAGYVTKIVASVPNTQFEVGTSQNVQAIWNNSTVIFNANCTITIPSILAANFIFNGITLAGVTVTWAITAPKTWLDGAPIPTTGKQIFTLVQRGSTNSILLLGV